MKQKEGSWKKRLEFFWMYEKVPFFIILAICLAGGQFAYAKVTQKDCVFEAMLFDIHTDVAEEQLVSSFCSYADIDLKKYDASVSTSLLLSDAASGNYAMASLSKFQAAVGTEDLDACMMLEGDFQKYAKSGCFLDLREIFSEEEIEGFPKKYTDPKGRILGVYSNGLKKMGEIGGYEKKAGIIGIVYNSKRKETAAKFLRFLNTESGEKVLL